MTRLVSCVLITQCFLKFMYAEEYIRYMSKAMVETIFIIQQQKRHIKGLLFKQKHLEIDYQLFIQYNEYNTV